MKVDTQDISNVPSTSMIPNITLTLSSYNAGVERGFSLCAAPSLLSGAQFRSAG